MNEAGWNLHSVAGADMPRQGAGQTIPELMLLCFTCGWMRASEYHSHLWIQVRV